MEYTKNTIKYMLYTWHFSIFGAICTFFVSEAFYMDSLSGEYNIHFVSGEYNVHFLSGEYNVQCTMYIVHSLFS